jgi:Holliday junction resolvase RusA-like endonuclease
MLANELYYVGEFCGKPRMTRKDKWQTRPATARYWAFKDMINIAAKDQNFRLGDQFEVKFFVKMPESWSKKKKSGFCGKPHQQRPDLDNYTKAVMDSLLREDSHVWSVWAAKYWWYENKIIVRNFCVPVVD